MLFRITSPLHNPKVHDSTLPASQRRPKSKPAGAPGFAELLARAHGKPDIGDAQLQADRQLSGGAVDLQPTLQLPR